MIGKKIGKKRFKILFSNQELWYQLRFNLQDHFWSQMIEKTSKEKIKKYLINVQRPFLKLSQTIVQNYSNFCLLNSEPVVSCFSLVIHPFFNLAILFWLTFFGSPCTQGTSWKVSTKALAVLIYVMTSSSLPSLKNALSSFPSIFNVSFHRKFQ